MSENQSYRKGLRNNYRSSVPLPEAIAKDLKFGWNDLMFWLFNGFKLPAIVAFPDFPSKRTTLFKISKRNKYRLTNKAVKNPDLVVYFHDATHGDNNALKQLYPNKRIINLNCIDISKKNVDQIHQEVFGYNTFVDPLKYSGIAVQKSDLNAMHDGRKINCPVDRIEADGVYQVLINNEISDALVMDYRVVVIGNVIPIVYKKFKSMENRFTNVVEQSELCNTKDILNSNEVDLILNFSKQIGSDFCELDVLRNKDDNKIYVIDVNKTPYGPPAGLPDEDTKKAVEILSTTFYNEFLK